DENPSELRLPKRPLGGTRYYLEVALAVGARLGSPTFFITLTANTRWPEIANELLPGQTALLMGRTSLFESC
ncbi:unnamed protein product, partial [Laminaria digitata]